MRTPRYFNGLGFEVEMCGNSKPPESKQVADMVKEKLHKLRALLEWGFRG